MIVLSALPGSGKSTWSRKFVEEHKNTHVVSSDDIRKEFFGKINCFDNEPLVWKTFLDRLNYPYDDSNEDVYVIADATNLQNKFREYYNVNTPGFDKHVLVLFDIPYEICLIQNKMRDSEKIVPETAMEKLRKEMEEPSDEVIKLYDEVIHVTEYNKTLMK